jgi:hypothetical protein
MKSGLRSAQAQVLLFRKLLTDKQYDPESPILGAAVKWLKNCPVKLEDLEREDLCNLVCQQFQVSRDDFVKLLFDTPTEQVRQHVEGIFDAKQIEHELLAILPTSGFFYEYAQFTRNSEAPLSYHVFCSLLAVGATLNRRAYIDMGYFKLFPPLGVILLGPSGIKKTTSTDIVVGILQDLAITKIYSEKLTPEALVEGMRDTAQGLVYAPELAVFLGKQKYNEGMIPLLTRFMDCPDAWTSETISRGAKPLTNVAISVLMCSTPDWFVENTPQDTFGGGFIARMLLVMQSESPRVNALPKPGSTSGRKSLAGYLARLHTWDGQIRFPVDVESAYVGWYAEHKQKSKNPEYDLLSTYYQRKPLHALRIAMIFHIVDHGTSMLCMECFERAVKLLEWNERFLPDLLREMFRTADGVDQSFILNTLRMHGGMIEHSTLMRKVQYKMNAAKLRNILNSLKEAKQVEERTQPVHAYIVKV